MAELWHAVSGLWKRRSRVDIDPTPPPAALSFLPGAHFHAVWSSYGSTFGATHTDILTKLKAMGAKVVRIDTSWAAWEPTQGVFVSRVYSGKLDDSLTWLAANDMKALVTCNESPAWATSTGTLRRLPDDPADMYAIGQYITEYLYATWGDTIAGVECWNEPDLSGFDDIGPRPEHYVDCLHHFYAGAKAGTGAAIPIAFSGMSAMKVAPVGTTLTNKDTQFYSYAYARMNTTWAGERPYDALGVHNYPVDQHATVASNGTEYWKLRHFEFLRAKMALEGDSRPVWITEGGYSAHDNTALTGQGAQPPWQVGLTEANQATWTTDWLTYMEDNYPEIKMVIVYNDWQAGDPNTATTYVDRHDKGYGILRPGSTRATTKPLYGALLSKFPTMTGGAPGPPTPSWPSVTTTLANVTPSHADLTGLSGMVMSALHVDIAYVINDHGANVVRMVNVRTGVVAGTITLTGATVVDWEDITRGPGNTILVGDIGDNALTRTDYKLYGFAEPTTLANATLTPTVYPFTYSDTLKHNPETLMWDPQNGRCYILTKISATDATVKWCEGPSVLSAVSNTFTIQARTHPTPPGGSNQNSFGGDFTATGDRYSLGRVSVVTVHDRAAGALLGTYSYSLTQQESCCWVPESTGVLLSSETFSSPPILYVPTF